MAFNSRSRKLSQQEMSQVDPSGRASSPFWGSRTTSKHRPPSKTREHDPTVPIGAAYSHASVLNADSFVNGIGNTGAPGTAIRKGLGHLGKESLPLGRKISDYERRAGAPKVDDEEDARRPLDYFGEDDDEDEFGLPSIASSRKSTRRAGGPSLDLSRTEDPRTPKKSSVGASGRPDDAERSSSFDIAEERGIADPLYTRKSEKKILRPQYKDILRDPVNSLQSIRYPPVPSSQDPHKIETHTARVSRINKFKRMLQASSVSLSDLRDSAWSGVPEEVRCTTWQFLLGYLPSSADRRVGTLDRKRREYLESVRQVFERGTQVPPMNGRMLPKSASGRSRGLDENVWHQISIDVPRTSPHIELYSYEATQRSLERILYLWAVRHPASGYVQGINDLVTPFWQVFLGSYITTPDIESGMDPGQLPKAVIDAVEADCYWCLTKLLDGIQDNYIYAQPGIVRQVGALRDLTHRIDKALAKHLEKEGVEFMQFSFRWMNCLLMREVNVKCTIRMWDTYMAEEQGFSEFHLYVCAAFLVKWTEQLLKMDFQEIMMFLQALPTKKWGEKEVELLLSEAFIWQSLFRGSSAHLKNPAEPRALAT